MARDRFRQQFQQRVDRSLGCALLGAHHLGSAASQQRSLIMVFQQLQDGCGQRLRSDNSQRIGFAEDFDDVAEVFGVRSDENWRSELRGFQHVVSTARHQASADKRQIGKLVQAGQLANRVEQEDASGDRLLPVPLRAPLITNARRRQQRSNRLEALGMPRRQHQQRAGISRHDLPECLQQHRFFAFQRAARHQHRADLFALAAQRRIATPAQTSPAASLQTSDCR